MIRCSCSALAAVLVVTLFAAAGCARDPDVEKEKALGRGNDYFARGEFPNAIIEYRRALQFDPRFGEARKRLAEAYVETGDVRNAFAQIVRAADVLHDDFDVQLRAGNFLLAAGQFEDAAARAEHILARQPSHAAAHTLKGNALAGLRDLEGALQELEEAAAADPDNGAIYANAALIHVERGSQAEAEAAFLTAIEISPELVLARVAYANFLITAARLPEAERVLKDAVATGPRDPTANRALALFYVITRRAAEAEPHLRVLAETSTDPEARFSLARFYLALDRRDDAMRELRTLAAAKETAADATLQIAAVEYARGERAEGRRLLAEVLAGGTAHPRARLLESQFLMAEGKLDEAITAARAAVSSDPRLLAAHLLLGEAYAQLRDVEEAKKAFSEVLRLQPRSVRAQLALSRLHLLTGNTSLAQQFAGRAASAAPDAPAAKTAVIRATLATRNLSRAESEIGAFLKEHPASAEGRVLEGTLRLMQKNFGAAERAFAKAAELDPVSPAAASGRVQALIAIGRRDAAKAYVTGLLDEHPNNPDFLLLSARTHATLGELAASEEALRQVLTMDQGRSEAYNMLGQLYVLQGRLDSALQEFRVLAERRPKAIGTHTMVAMILQVQDRRDEARQAYRKVLALDRNAAVATNNLAWMLAEDNALDEALPLAHTAKSRLPESPHVAHTLGWIYYRMGLFSSAVTELRQAVATQPENATYQYHLGLASAGNQDWTLARGALESALELAPDAPESAEARQTLSKIAAVTF